MQMRRLVPTALTLSFVAISLIAAARPAAPFCRLRIAHSGVVDLYDFSCEDHGGCLTSTEPCFPHSTIVMLPNPYAPGGWELSHRWSCMCIDPLSEEDVPYPAYALFCREYVFDVELGGQQPDYVSCQTENCSESCQPFPILDLDPSEPETSYLVCRCPTQDDPWWP